MTTIKETQPVLPPPPPITNPSQQPVIAKPVSPQQLETQLNKKQVANRKSKYSKKKLVLRQQLWGDIAKELLWERNTHDGYTTLPRTLPIMFLIMDDLADKGKPISSTYFSLWARVFDECFIEVKSSDDLAFESGFSGQRAVSTWKQRMKKLIELGFIDVKSSGANEFGYVLLYNPYNLIKKFHQLNKIQDAKYNALFARALDVGANDLS
tara:strand:+ start:2073 stop:2702 length:630 start_codon:yes stop_codon:yes gene_type:complete